MKKATVFFILIASVFAYANSGEAHGEDAGIPFGKIGIQALNLGILLVAMIYFVRKSITDFFSNRQAVFNEQSQKTAVALKHAESELKEIKDKLSLLESSEAASISKANTEAENTKNKMISEAKTQAEKMKADVALIINAEVYKAKNEIRNQIIEKSISTAKDSVRASSQAITEKSEQGFISDLGQVKA
jgi:F-type H+-transporting ATPase subunit b